MNGIALKVMLSSKLILTNLKAYLTFKLFCLVDHLIRVLVLGVYCTRRTIMCTLLFAVCVVAMRVSVSSFLFCALRKILFTRHCELAISSIWLFFCLCYAFVLSVYCEM